MPGNVVIHDDPNPAAYREIDGKVPPLSRGHYPDLAVKPSKWLTKSLDYCALADDFPVARVGLGYLQWSNKAILCKRCIQSRLLASAEEQCVSASRLSAKLG
jgi:hypothetical protein